MFAEDDGAVKSSRVIPLTLPDRENTKTQSLRH